MDQRYDVRSIRAGLIAEGDGGCPSRELTGGHKSCEYRNACGNVIVGEVGSDQ